MSQMLAWSLRDPEQRIGFSGGRYTQVNHLLSGLLAGLLTAAVYGAIFPFRGSQFGDSFFRSGNLIISVAIVFFTSWAIVILALKMQKLRLQRRALQLTIVPNETDFVLSPHTAAEIQDNISESVDDPRHFMLFNRISYALSNLQNLGRVGDVAEIFKTQAEYDEASMESSYLIVSAFVWAIPVLGFIGTVLGLSTAIGEFGGVLQTDDDMSLVKDKLQGVTAGLSTAFETTLQGLLAALVVQLAIVWNKKREQDFLDESNEYCTRHIVSRLRLMPFEE